MSDQSGSSSRTVQQIWKEVMEAEKANQPSRAAELRREAEEVARKNQEGRPSLREKANS